MPPLPDIDFRAIRPHADSRNRAFEELCYQLLPWMEPMTGSIPVRHGTPDGGVEFLITLPDGDVLGWQAKYLFKLGPDEYGQLDRSVKAALACQPNLRRYTFCLPYNRPAGGHPDAVSALQKWNEHHDKWRRWATEQGHPSVEFDYVGESELLRLLTNEEHAGRVYYWFDATVLSLQWFRDRLEETIRDAGPRYTPVLNVGLPIAFVFEGLGRTQVFRDRLRSLLKDLRNECHWYELRQLSEKDASLKATADEAALSIAEIDARVLAVDVSGTLPLDVAGILAACATATKCLAHVRELLGAREREHHATVLEQDKSAQSPTPAPGDQRDEWAYRSASALMWRTHSAVRSLSAFAETEAARLINLPALLLTGQPGTGKTHLLCDVASKRLNAGLPSVVLLGQHFGPGDPWTQLLSRLHLDCTPDQFLGALNAAAEAIGGRALLLIDALNEAATPRMWRDHLASFVATARRYPRVGIGVSCRNSFVKFVIPDSMLPTDLVEVEHLGFGEQTSEAVRSFFGNSNLVLPDFPLVVPEFRNPLFLKLMCEALHRRGENRFPRGATAVSAIFSLFLDEIDRRLAVPDRCDYPSGQRMVHAAVDRLARDLLARDGEWLPVDVARRLTDELLPGRDWSRSLLCGLISEGVLIRDALDSGVPDGSMREIVHFAYQRLGDHARAAIMCADAAGVDGIAARLEAWTAEDWGLYLHSNLLEALSIHVPEMFDGREVYELMPDPSEQPVRDAYLHSLLWRKPSAFRQDHSLDYLNSIPGDPLSTSDPVLDTLLQIACVPDHPLNAQLLHKNLWRRSMAERDAWWTVYLQYNHGADAPAGRLIDWAWQDDASTCADDAALLCAIALAWCLASSNRMVRDRATKALVSLLRPRLSILIDLLKLFHGVNDVYIAERLYAVAYGCVLGVNDPKGVAPVATLVYEQVFADGEPPVHVLLRDYARGVVERALFLGARLAGVDATRVRPRYVSPWPIRIPSIASVEGPTGGERDPYAAIRFSVMTADFRRYVIQPKVGRFVAPNQRARRRAEQVRREKEAAASQAAFEQSLTEGQREALRSLKAKDLLGFERFRDGLNSDQLRKLSAVLNLSKPWRRRGEPIPFDVYEAARWIFHHVLDLGWTPERFGEFDQRQRYESQFRRGYERIG